MANTSLEPKLVILKDRAECLAKARAFFAARSIVEVDTPILSHSAPVDEHIDVLRVLLPKEEMGYLHTSPEYAMKRLISEGIGDIYQLSHVFREGEIGARHNPEFTMAEWYRIGMEYEPFIEETLDFLRCFLGELPSAKISYRDSLIQYAGIDYLHATHSDLLDCAKKHAIALSEEACEWDDEILLHLILCFVVEPNFGQEELTVLLDYPSTEAALARTKQKGDEVVAERFEVYYRGIELCNGYHELTDPVEQRRRFVEANQYRAAAGKNQLPIDERFLAAMQKGIPDCCGVAVGFDRLMMLRHQAKDLSEVLPFTWSTI